MRNCTRGETVFQRVEAIAAAYTAPMRRMMTFIVAAACLAGGSAHAQWQWLDKSGRKVFSDQAPSPDVPERNILKRPGKATAASAPVASAAAPGIAASATASPQAPALVLTQDDKALQAGKAKAQAEAQAKVKAEEQAKAQVKTSNCNEARKNQAVMDSGVRVSITNTKGEREILDDAARAAQQKKIQTVIEQNCK